MSLVIQVGSSLGLWYRVSISLLTVSCGHCQLPAPSAFLARGPFFCLQSQQQSASPWLRTSPASSPVVAFLWMALLPSPSTLEGSCHGVGPTRHAGSSLCFRFCNRCSVCNFLLPRKVTCSQVPGIRARTAPRGMSLPPLLDCSSSVTSFRYFPLSSHLQSAILQARKLCTRV